MPMTDLIARFVQFLPVWAKDQDVVLSPQDHELGEDLLVALGVLYLSLMVNEEPNPELPTAILTQTNTLFAPLLLGILEDITLDSLVKDTQGRQDVLDRLHDDMAAKFPSVSAKTV